MVLLNRNKERAEGGQCARIKSPLHMAEGGVEVSFVLFSGVCSASEERGKRAR